MARLTKSQINNRPHTCCGKIFQYHDALKFHIIREHLVRESMIPKCILACEMLVKEEPC